METVAQGLWVSLPIDLLDDPRTARLARLLGVEKDIAFLRLTLLYMRAMKFMPDGDVSGSDAYDIAALADWGGDAQQFQDALLASKFLQQEADGRLTIANWSVLGGRYFERKKEREKKARQRGATDSVPPPIQPTRRDMSGQTGDVPGMSRGQLGDIPAQERENVVNDVQEQNFVEMRRNDGARARNAGSITLLKPIDEMDPNERARLDLEQQELAAELEAAAAFEAAEREAKRQAALQAAGHGASVWDRWTPEKNAAWLGAAANAGMMPRHLPVRESAAAEHQVAEAVTA